MASDRPGDRDARGTVILASVRERSTAPLPQTLADSPPVPDVHYLVGTDSVHATAAASDYLEELATPEDEVTVVAVAAPENPPARRDCQEALNVAPVRLTGVDRLETELREGEPAAELLEVARERDADEIVVGVRSGRPDSTAQVGSTARSVLTAADRPVVVVPLPEP